MRVGNSSRVEALIKAIEQILAEKNEEQTREIVLKANIAFKPAPLFEGYRVWLASLAKRLYRDPCDYLLVERLCILGRYFGQDWDDWGDTEQRVIEKIATENSAPEIQDLVQAIEQILAEKNEKEADEIVSMAGVSFVPTETFRGYRPWLASLVKRLRR
jgi:hypothetical protein